MLVHGVAPPAVCWQQPCPPMGCSGVLQNKRMSRGPFPQEWRESVSSAALSSMEDSSEAVGSLAGNLRDWSQQASQTLAGAAHLWRPAVLWLPRGLCSTGVRCAGFWGRFAHGRPRPARAGRTGGAAGFSGGAGAARFGSAAPPAPPQAARAAPAAAGSAGSAVEQGAARAGVAAQGAAAQAKEAAGAGAARARGAAGAAAGRAEEAADEGAAKADKAAGGVAAKAGEAAGAVAAKAKEAAGGAERGAERAAEAVSQARGAPAALAVPVTPSGRAEERVIMWAASSWAGVLCPARRVSSMRVRPLNSWCELPVGADTPAQWAGALGGLGAAGSAAPGSTTDVPKRRGSIWAGSGALAVAARSVVAVASHFLQSRPHDRGVWGWFGAAPAPLRAADTDRVCSWSGAPCTELAGGAGGRAIGAGRRRRRGARVRRAQRPGPRGEGNRLRQRGRRAGRPAAAEEGRAARRRRHGAGRGHAAAD